MSTATLYEDLKEKLLIMVREHHLIDTPERHSILKAISEQEGPFSIKDIECWISVDCEISQKTVYNTIHLFERFNIIGRAPSYSGRLTYIVSQ